MQALEFWKTVTVDHANLLDSLIGLLNEHHVKYCVIGGQAVNAYAEPVVSLDLHLVIATDQLADAEHLAGGAVRGAPVSAQLECVRAWLRLACPDPDRSPLRGVRGTGDCPRSVGSQVARGACGRCPDWKNLGRVGSRPARKQTPERLGRHCAPDRELPGIAERSSAGNLGTAYLIYPRFLAAISSSMLISSVG